MVLCANCTLHGCFRMFFVVVFLLSEIIITQMRRLRLKNPQHDFSLNEPFFAILHIKKSDDLAHNLSLTENQKEKDAKSCLRTINA